MIALAAQLRILFVLMALGLAAYLLWRGWQRLGPRLAQDPRARAWAAGGGGRLLRALLLRGGLVALLRLLRLLRWFR